jgi:hypothetical protein
MRTWPSASHRWWWWWRSQGLLRTTQHRLVWGTPMRMRSYRYTRLWMHSCSGCWLIDAAALCSNNQWQTECLIQPVQQQAVYRYGIRPLKNYLWYHWQLSHNYTDSLCTYRMSSPRVVHSRTFAQMHLSSSEIAVGAGHQRFARTIVQTFWFQPLQRLQTSQVNNSKSRFMQDYDFLWECGEMIEALSSWQLLPSLRASVSRRSRTQCNSCETHLAKTGWFAPEN